MSRKANSSPHLVPALPGCITEGDTLEEWENNLKDAIEGWLEVANDNYATEDDTQILEVAERSLNIINKAMPTARLRQSHFSIHYIGDRIF